MLSFFLSAADELDDEELVVEGINLAARLIWGDDDWTLCRSQIWFK